MDRPTLAPAKAILDQAAQDQLLEIAESRGALLQHGPVKLFFATLAWDDVYLYLSREQDFAPKLVALDPTLFLGDLLGQAEGVGLDYLASITELLVARLELLAELAMRLPEATMP